MQKKKVTDGNDATFCVFFLATYFFLLGKMKT